jgi:hypothetical protein
LRRRCALTTADFDFTPAPISGTINHVPGEDVRPPTPRGSSAAGIESTGIS